MNKNMALVELAAYHRLPQATVSAILKDIDLVMEALGAERETVQYVDGPHRRWVLPWEAKDTP